VETYRIFNIIESGITKNKDETTTVLDVATL
jgi:hypothetical protein